MAEPDTEERILDAAHAVFLRRGTAGARMQEVADEADVNKALLHYYFRSKDRLAQAVFGRALRVMVPRVLEVLRGDEGIDEKVRRVVSFYIDTLTANPFLPNYILGELTHHPERIQQAFEATAGGEMGAIGAEVRSTLGRQLEEEAAAGRLRPMAPEEFVLNLLSLVIFPFAGRPLLSPLLGVDGEGFAGLMERRKETLPEFILNAMRP
jgi:TetR/AcrR family transcriptional regulator